MTDALIIDGRKEQKAQPKTNEIGRTDNFKVPCSVRTCCYNASNKLCFCDMHFCEMLADEEKEIRASERAKMFLALEKILEKSNFITANDVQKLKEKVAK